jgi:hypothetical protein
MDRATALRTGVRLAVLDQACSNALVFELSSGVQQQQPGGRRALGWAEAAP